VTASADGDQERLVSAVERIVSAGVGLTAVALTGTAEAAELTLPQWRALVLVGGSPGSRIGELATSLGVSLPSASRLVRRMERSGLVLTARDEIDRRATNVVLTDRGRVVVSAVRTCRRAALAAALATIGTDLATPSVGSLEAIADALAHPG
jgi:DNA-binding MarR family transcriptional regulator